MKSVKELAEEAEAKVDELEELEGKLQDAETDEEREQLEGKLEAKEEEVDDAVEALERAKEREGKKQKVTDIKSQFSTDDDGKTLDPEGEGEGKNAKPAQPKDPNKEKREEEKIFMDYLQGKELSGRARTELAPESDNFEEGSDGASVPSHLLSSFFGKRWAKSMQQGKTLLSNESGEDNLVDDEYREELLELEPEPGHLLGRVTIVPTDNGTIKIPRLLQTDTDEYGGVSFNWINEGSQKDETDPDFEQVTVSTHECAGYTEMSKTMISRSRVGLVSLLRRLYRSAARAEIDDQIMGGSGSGQPLGIINTSGIRTQVRDSTDDIAKKDFVNLKHKILSHHRDQTSWVIHDSVEQELELSEIGTASTNMQFFTGENEILNYAYEVTERQPKLGSDGDVIYGDPSWYYMAQEQEVVIETSRHYKFRDNLQAFVLYFLIGGRLVEPRAMAILEGATS